MTPEQFRDLITPITAYIGTQPLDTRLDADLNAKYPANGPVFTAVFDTCRKAIEAGWMSNREAGGIKYGRVMKPSPETRGFSVDVVDMQDVKGPHHRHPKGEIEMIMPLTADAKFDGHGEGWFGLYTLQTPRITRP